MNTKTTTELKLVPISKLVPYANNARTHSPEQIMKLRSSLREFGFINPVIIDRDYGVIAGHGRILAARDEGIAEVPCVFADHLSEAQKKAYIIADNRMAMDAGWDEELLRVEIEALQAADFDPLLTGFDEKELADLFGEEEETVKDDDFDLTAALEKASFVERGDVWTVGRHRLMCGDSTSAEDVAELMGGRLADMVMTDPPYGINAEKMTMGTGAKKFYRGDGWDSERPDISIALTLADNVCIWGGNYFADILPVSNDWLVWHKKNDGLSFSECELAWTNFGRNIRHISHHWGSEKKLHVTMKPVEVMAWAIQQARGNAETIVDLFGGSGSTLIACEQLGRDCFMMELDPKYIDVIIERWETFTGQKAVLISERKG